MCGRDFLDDGTEVGSIYGDPALRAEFGRRIPRLVVLVVASFVVWRWRWGTGGAVWAIALAVLMAGGVYLWARYRPRSYGRFVRANAAIVGGLPGEKLPWKTRSRALVLTTIGVLGVVAASAVIAEPGGFVGGRAGGLTFGLLSGAALVGGLVLLTRST